MRKAMFALAVVVGAIASCSAAKDLAQFTPIAEEFVKAAGAGDSASLRGLSRDTLAFRRGLLFWRLEKRVAHAALEGLRPRYGHLRPDTADVGFATTGPTRYQINFRFVRHNGVWVVQNIFLPPK